MKSTNYQEIANGIKRAEQKELAAALKAHGGKFEFNEDIQRPVVEFYNELNGPKSGIVSAVRLEDKVILMTVTDTESETYEIDADDVYPGCLSVVTEFLPEPQEKGLSVGERLNRALDLLRPIPGSGYIPFSSPAPSSTERAIKTNLENAIRSLEKTIAFHEARFGKTNPDKE